jgi:uncharacterized protein (DUF1697 family)
VRTYVQSGNVVASSEHSSPAEVADEMSALVKAEFGLDVPTTVRTAEQLDQVIAANPYPQAARERPKLLHVSFLLAEPDPERVAAVHDNELTKDVCRVVDGTARNWRTVTTLAQMAAESRR